MYHGAGIDQYVICRLIRIALFDNRQIVCDTGGNHKRVVSRVPDERRITDTRQRIGIGTSVDFREFASRLDIVTFIGVTNQLRG